MKPNRRQRNSSLTPELHTLCAYLVEARRQARQLGLFIGDRELLSCAKCGLEEDVDITSRLFTYRPDTDFQDTGLRFRNLGRQRFRCPSCSAVVREPEPSPSCFHAPLPAEKKLAAELDKTRARLDRRP